MGTTLARVAAVLGVEPITGLPLTAPLGACIALWLLAEPEPVCEHYGAGVIGSPQRRDAWCLPCGTGLVRSVARRRTCQICARPRPRDGSVFLWAEGDQVCLVALCDDCARTRGERRHEQQAPTEAAVDAADGT